MPKRTTRTRILYNLEQALKTQKRVKVYVEDALTLSDGRMFTLVSAGEPLLLSIESIIDLLDKVLDSTRLE